MRSAISLTGGFTWHGGVSQHWCPRSPSPATSAALTSGLSQCDDYVRKMGRGGARKHVEMETEEVPGVQPATVLAPALVMADLGDAAMTRRPESTPPRRRTGPLVRADPNLAVRV